MIIKQDGVRILQDQKFPILKLLNITVNLPFIELLRLSPIIRQELIGELIQIDKEELEKG